MKTYFFLESTCTCVLGPWPWPRAFMSLASRVSVLGKAVLGLGFFFVSLALASSLVFSTLPLINSTKSQRWSPRGRLWPRGRPRGQILKSLALASKVKSLALASRPQVLENWPVLGSRTALFFELLKFCEALENFFGKRFFVEIA